MCITEFPLVGIFGGTFDPVHYGHLRSADDVRVALGISDFRMIPAGDPPHRDRPQTSAIDRLAMLRLGMEEFPGLREDTREMEREGPSWMVDTLKSLRLELPDSALLLILGQDAFNRFNHWHRWESIFDLAHIVVMNRPGEEEDYEKVLLDVLNERKADRAEDLRTAQSGLIHHLEIRQRDISSTEIRHELKSLQTGSEWLPLKVTEYIQRHGLYR